jgi:hypothetical protein
MVKVVRLVAKLEAEVHSGSCFHALTCHPRPKRSCHPGRSAAEWRALLLLCHPERSEAKPNAVEGPLYLPTLTVSSRPERNVVEGPAFALPS